MDWNEMHNAYQRATQPEHPVQNPKTKTGNNYGGIVTPARTIRYDHIVVYKTDGTYAICRSNDERMFEYEEMGIVKTRIEAIDIAKLLNQREGNK